MLSGYRCVHHGCFLLCVVLSFATSTKEVMFSLALICLFVALYKNSERIFTKFGGKGKWSMKNY